MKIWVLLSLLIMAVTQLAHAGGAGVAPTIGDLIAEDGETPISNARWYTAKNVGDGLSYAVSPNSLALNQWLTADLLLDGDEMTVFELCLIETGGARTFRHHFALLNQCSARLALPLEAVLQNRWQYPRRGAYLKPLCFGDRVDLSKVDRLTLTVLRKGPKPVRFCLTPFEISDKEPEKLTEPVLPRGKLLDDLGQSQIHDWPGKSKDVEEVVARLKQQRAAAREVKPRDGYSNWGGSAPGRFEATGFFRTHHDGRRWWLVDPDGSAFFSVGPDVVEPDLFAFYDGLETAIPPLPDPNGEFKAALGKRSKAVNYLTMNLIRAFGPDDWRDAWADLTLGEMRNIGFNTVGAWSDWRAASKRAFPYVRALDKLDKPLTPNVYRDFPDVFADTFTQDCDAFAEQLRETRGDKALIGYFLMNEPTWGFASETPAAGMLFSMDECASRRVLADELRAKYGSEEKLRAAWDIPTLTFDAIARGKWPASVKLPDAAKKHLADFSTTMVDKLFSELRRACRAVDPVHLNLGARYHTVPPGWALKGMKHFDVLSVNAYAQQIDAKKLGAASELLGKPVIIGEFHFGALDAGLPAPGIVHVKNQLERGRAYQAYIEHAARQSWCVGAHWFQLYDQSAIGRFDGENGNIGFLDVCNRPYEDLAKAARQTHGRIYKIANEEEPPTAERATILPPLFN